MCPASKASSRYNDLGEGTTRDNDYNENWEDAIRSYDEECLKRDRTFEKRHLLVNPDGCGELEEDENEVLRLFLAGHSFEDIAEKAGVDAESIAALLEIIRLKLSLGSE